MPLKKSRFIHHQTPNARNFRGFSVLMEPSAEENKVVLSITMCARVDHFCKRLAREQLTNHGKREVVSVSDLPMILASLVYRSFGVRLEKMESQHKRQAANQWAWVWKYFL